MLDSETKRRIDTARDILVGKVPDPKSQVEQITIALIYKFMDDMDNESIEMGGEASFFTGEFEKYRWRNLIDKSLGGIERLELYTDAISRLPQNPGMPQLFRDIFKNAFLPYRDPETLSLFLKTINEFKYDHSERLGDAFEYLLSVLGSQGDAGQFRTPRHIIDFMVEVLDPKKDETILDPACGTAGFLISSYKHIVAQNTNETPGDQLTPSDRKQLIENFRGYDISPDMVRLSLVNMYLHQFTNPQIFEYDTLTSEVRWNEHYDVILANPPFMSPKGGIKPHNKFSIPSNRSEVLFVDYIAEHLLPDGRAAIIVPEGIIFQSGTAYKALRKMLVEGGFLWAVVSLPAGVFNPYSGVKTSILLLDKQIASKTDKILFVKIENDGFGLGAQRREIIGSNLPDAKSLIQKFKSSILEDRGFEIESDMINIVVPKAELENGEYNLSMDKYNAQSGIGQSKFELVTIGSTFETSSGGTPDKKHPEYYQNGTIPWLKSGEVAQGFIFRSEEFITEEALKNSSAKIFPANTVLVAMYGATAGQVGILKIDAATNQAICGILPNEKAIPEYIYYILKSRKDDLVRLSTGGAQPNISQGIIKQFNIPLPPTSIQQQIVEEIEGYQRIIDGARQVVESYRPRITIDPEWKMVELGKVCEINPKKSELSNLDGTELVSFVPMADLGENEISFIPKEVRPLQELQSSYTYFRDHDVLLAKVTPCFENGKAGIAENLKNGIGFGSSEYYVLRCSEVVHPMWIYLLVTSDQFRVEGKLRMTGTGGLQRVPRDFVDSYIIPLPSIEIQTDLIKQVEHERSLVTSNKILVTIFEQKIRNRMSEIWGEKEPIN